jgi:ParB family chromosome partitioning protein
VTGIPIEDIMPNPHQPRMQFDPAGLKELAASIREHGVIQPLIVARSRPTDPAPYQIIAGERRWRAAQLAGLADVPVIVKEASEIQMLELALVENLQRTDLSPLEAAEAYRALMEEFGLSQQQVAERVGKSRAAVANTVRLLKLPEPVRALLAGGSLSEGHARALLALTESEALVRAAEQVVARDLTVRQTEELVRRLAAANPHSLEPEPPADPDGAYTRRLEEAFRSALGTKVRLTRGRNGGQLVISFFSDEELNALFERIVSSEL